MANNPTEQPPKVYDQDGDALMEREHHELGELLAILRPANRNLTVDDLRSAFKIVSEMIARKPGRIPSASVSFLGARANKLVGPDGKEPSFETVLRAMHEGGYSGDVYPSP